MMPLLAAIVSCVMAAESPTTNPATAELVVHVRELRNTRGAVRVGVFDGPEGFPEQASRALLWRSLPADAQNLSVQLALPPGRYAIVVFHDENGNKKMDRNFFGIPKEGYGVSNNPRPALRAATYDEAVFELRSEGAELAVSIQYF